MTLALAAADEAAKPITIVTLTGEKFERAIVTRVDVDAITVKHSTGIARIPFSNLSPELRSKFGFDPQRLAAFNEAQTAAEKAQAEADAKRQEKANAEQQAIRERRAKKLAVLRQWASRNLIMANHEDQLRAALAARYFQQRGGKPLSAAEFAFLDQETKISIILYMPEMLLPELLDQ